MKRARKPKWSIVVMRGADKSVKQFQVSKRSVLAAPTAVILAVSGCIAGLQMKSAYELQHLEEQLSMQDAYFTQSAAGKDEAIISLQKEILHLSRQAQELETKFDELQELEHKLKQFIAKYGSGIPLSGRSVPGESRERSVQTLSAITGKPVLDSPELKAANPLALQARNSGLNLKALSAMVDAMEQSMAQTLQLAQARRTAVDGYPSLWPTKSKQLTSGFGYRSDPLNGRIAFHAGIDIAGRFGDPIFSAAEGTVSETGYDSSYGNYIIIQHFGDLQSAYMHLSHIEAKENDIVVQGEKIGLLGSSGRSTGPHLHFQIMQENKPVNPVSYLDRKSNNREASSISY